MKMIEKIIEAVIKVLLISIVIMCGQVICIENGSISSVSDIIIMGKIITIGITTSMER